MKKQLLNTTHTHTRIHNKSDWKREYKVLHRVQLLLLLLLSHFSHVRQHRGAKIWEQFF